MKAKAEPGHSDEGEEEKEEDKEAVWVSEDPVRVLGGLFRGEEEVLERGRRERSDYL